MPGWPFVNPALLGGLALVAVPILIHLLSRRQYRRLPWAAMEFLRQAERRLRRRLQIEQWLLIALRCLAVALLVLLLARPFAQAGLLQTLLGQAVGTPRFVLIDDSASLAFRTEGRTDFTRARSAAERLLDWLHAEAAPGSIAIYRTSAPEEPLFEAPALDAVALETARERLRSVEPTALRGNPEAGLARIQSQIAARGGPADVYVVSDFQRSDWSVDGDSALAALAGASDAVRCVLVAVARNPRDNAAIVDLRPLHRQVVAGLPLRVDAEVANLGDAALANVAVRFECEGAPTVTQEIPRLEPGATAPVSAELVIPREGHFHASASLADGDTFPLDDTRRFVGEARPAIRVLIVNGDPAAEPLADEAFFLRYALAPPGPLISGVSVTEIEPDELPTTELSDFDCVLLANVPPLPNSDVRTLEEFARGGGGVAFFLGSRARDPAAFNAAFHDDGAGLLPAAVLEQRTHGGPEPGVGMAAVEEHELTALLPATGGASGGGVYFRTWYVVDAPSDGDAQAAPAADSRSPSAQDPEAASPPGANGRTGGGAASGSVTRVLARFDDSRRTPALLVKPFGDGRTLLFTSTIDLDWNTWPRAVDGSYLVTVMEIVRYLARVPANPADFEPGEPLTVAFDAQQYRPQIVFHPPARSRSSPVTAAPDGSVPARGLLTLAGPVAREVGFYRAELQHRDGVPESRLLAVNLEPAESELAVLEEVELRSRLGATGFDYFFAEEAFTEGTQPARREFWRGLLVALLVCLTIEQFLAWWFGRPRRSAPASGVLLRQRTHWES